MMTKREEYRECYLMAHLFDMWLLSEPDPESVRDVQRFWKGLKAEYGVLNYNE